MLHFIDVSGERARLGRIAKDRQLELEAGQNGSEIMADAGQHRGALLDVRLDAVAHFQECLAGLPHFARAARAQVVWNFAALAEGIGRFSELQDRPDLIAQEQDRDRQQDDGGADHPQQKDVRVGSVSLAARGNDAQNGVFVLDPNFNGCGFANGVDPERPLDVLFDFIRQRAVKQSEKWFRPRRR